MSTSILQYQQTIQAYQTQITMLTAQMNALIAASNDNPTIRATATVIHTQQCTNGPSCPWYTETGATADLLWANPEHAFWARAAKTAMVAGVYDPVTP